MEETRIKKLEITVDNLNRRFDEHDELHTQDAIWKIDTDKRMAMHHETLEELKKQTAILIKVAPSIDSMAHYLEKTYDVVTPLAKLSGFIIKIGGGAIIVWHLLKLAIAKLAFLWS